MKWQGVKSSNILRVRYDDKEKAMEVEFNNGGTYRYADVPKKLFEGMVQAPSAGKYFFAEIKGKFESVNLNPKEKGVEDGK